MVDALREALQSEPDVAYALLFGSSARGTGRPGSDADVAVELAAGAARDVRALGRLIARLESATGRSIDLVLLDEAPPPLADPPRAPALAVHQGHRVEVPSAASWTYTRVLENRCIEKYSLDRFSPAQRPRARSAARIPAQ